METYRIENEVPLFGVEAISFPGGVQQAWQDLHGLLPTTEGRSFYGISHGTCNGEIVYKACVEERARGEAGSFGLSRFVLPAGEYRGTLIRGFMLRLPEIGETFRTLLADGDYDESGVCVERYLNDEDVVCMIKRKGGD